MKNLLVISLFLLSACAIAKKNNNTIPFFIANKSEFTSYKVIENNKNQEQQESGKEVVMLIPHAGNKISNNKVIEVEPNELSKFVTKIKNSICNAVVDGEIKVWIKGGVEAKPLGIGTSAESGLEILIRCTQTGINKINQNK